MSFGEQQMKLEKRMLALFAIVVFVLCGFAPGTVPAASGSPGSPPSYANQPGMCKSTDFALKLFSHQTKASRDNVVVSPFSAYAALSMTMNGADGNTYAQMAKVLGVAGADLSAVNKANQEVLASLTASKDVQLEISNAIYADSNTHFKSTFIDLCKSWYGAEAQSLEFGPAAVSAINGWCSQKTHGKITSIIRELSRDDKMVLLNAVYFKGPWAKRFQPAFTKDDQFSTLAGGRQPVKMMHQQDILNHMKGEGFQAVAIPYLGKKQSMLIFLPDKGVDFSRFCEEFTPENWKQWMTLFQSKTVRLWLPRFHVEYSTELSKTLAAMGMKDAFSEAAANFSLMVPSPLRVWIGAVIQKTYMDVKEEGTEAAAVTAVMMMGGARPQEPESVVEFRVDRPFVLALVDEDTQEILFLGSIVKP
jgi:serine protease inhibitor